MSTRVAGGAHAGHHTVRETILGITTPWQVARVELKTDEKRVDLWLEHEATRWPCPECGELLAGFDHAKERTWRHLERVSFRPTYMRGFNDCSAPCMASNKYDRAPEDCAAGGGNGYVGAMWE